jgi:hypothetical protein
MGSAIQDLDGADHLPVIGVNEDFGSHAGRSS